ncbi:hypothetical protein F4780DRAFT_739408 [Xylariomycetidae sp. FL0641]|nr:hypothetical protein F4780DRAFT_739408 [Xylariomycetidae sp. FL0641]
MNSHPDEISHRDRESAERHHRDQYPAGTPHHSSTASLHLHQPVASRLPGAIHSPGGLLANHGGSGAPVPLGAPAGPVNSLGGPLQNDSNRPHPHNAQNASNQMYGAISGPNPGPGPGAGGPAHVFGGPLQQEAGRPGQGVPFAGGGGGGAGGMPPQGHPMPAGGSGGGGGGNGGGSGALPQGQQPILNDALSYLDQVKVQFADQADVYNKFLDIMKDFKSQTIDTPGVINRVSELFAGHPNLIQGFNTFLPPGYRIECGAGNDPNTIRVTTPMGTTVQSITGRANQGEGAHGSSGSNVPFNHRASNWQQQPQPHSSIESPEAAFSMPVANGGGIFGAGQGQGPTSAFDGPSAGSQQQQRGGGGHPQNNSTTPNAPPTRNALTPTPGLPLGTGNGSNSQQANIEKRGPVEFNHAISYVNKIKNRFQDQPEIYKNFLEILQTYQKEQKPIQDVYAQVTKLFNAAPDLLEDFKQFLPESAASNKNGARSEDVLALTGLAQSTPQPSHLLRDGQKMPPVGNFAPPASATKDNKKRPRNEKQHPTPATMADSPAPGSRSMPGGGSSNKRPKIKDYNALGAAIPPLQPTLTPTAPAALPPLETDEATPEQVAIFTELKKVLPRYTFNEFIKLCNLVSQELIDIDKFLHETSKYLGQYPELFAGLKGLVREQGPAVTIVDNHPRPPTEKVSLSNCRGSGPSYRLLPRREKLKPCGGRDEMCNAVLNDQWASHPTWSSEDSGFVAHRKNAFEEGLHRVEEERHDYDYHIELNAKCIQLLEPIAQQMLNLPPQERDNFKMPEQLGGSSTSIYKRVLKKIYGPERGAEACNELFVEPYAVVPVILARMKQKDEEWRFSHREWTKAWHAQTETMYQRSLDHRGITVKQNDKRNLSTKHLVDIIKTKHEEQRRLRNTRNRVPRYQFAYELADEDVVLDLLRLMVLYSMHNGQHSTAEKERINEFFESFVPQFFDLAEERVQERLRDINRDSCEEDTEEQLPAELTNGRTRRGKKSDLLRGVLDPGRNGTKTRAQKEDSAASGSKETTPDVGSANDEEMADAPEDGSPPDLANERWLPIVPRLYSSGVTNPLLDADGELKADGFFPRPWYNFFCNQTLYVFFSIFQTIYKRLKEVKDDKQGVLEEIARSKAKKPAKDLGIGINELDYFDENQPASFWPKTLELVEDYITGEVDETRYQDVLRHYYLQNGWKLYTILDLMKILSRLSLTCTSTDSKEKTPDLIQQYLNSRQQEETSYQTEISARKFAEKCIKDGDLFVICWFPKTRQATVRWLQRDETTFYMDEMGMRERWQYYISSYMRVEPTEGIDRSRLQKTVLARNLPSSETDSDDGNPPKPLKIDESLVLRIDLHSNKIHWEDGTSEYFIYSCEPETEDEKNNARDRASDVREHRDQMFREKFVMNNAWMRGMSQDDVQKMNEKFQNWIKSDTAPTSNVRGDGDEPMEGIS